MNNLLRIIILTIGLSVNLTLRSQTYEFFQTRNYHNQLRLNTKTGEVYQVQDDGGSWIVNNAFDTLSLLALSNSKYVDLYSR